MVTLHPEYVVDDRDQRKAVLLPVSEWEQIVAELEEFDDIRAYDEAKSGTQAAVPFEQAVCEIQAGYKE
jgi:hypothetical protein